MAKAEDQTLLNKIAQGFKQKWAAFLGWFTAKPKINESDIHLEPKYWPEVIDLMETLNSLLAMHTIDDANIRHVNSRILEYLEEQINIKGTLPNLELRYSALDTVADRFLTNSLNKLVGLKHMEDSHAEFSDAITLFKKRLHERHQQELKQL